MRLGKYAAEDADITYQLYEILDKEIKKENLKKLLMILNSLLFLFLKIWKEKE